MENEYYTIKSAASLLGVTTLTLRNWDKQGKLIPYRHPFNNYRLYKKNQIEEILERLERRRDIPRKIEVSISRVLFQFHLSDKAATLRIPRDCGVAPAHSRTLNVVFDSARQNWRNHLSRSEIASGLKPLRTSPQLDIRNWNKELENQCKP